MARARDLLPVFLCFLLTPASLVCQASRQVPAPHQHPIPAPIDLAESVPFSLNPIAGEHFSIRSADQMSPADKDLLASAHSAILEATRNMVPEYSEPGWSAEQIDCPALSNHLLIRFTRTRGKGDVSVFTAAVRRNSPQQVQIIPVLRGGYSLFTPAARNNLTIATFNHIRAEQKSTGKPNWVEVARCYVALAGSDPDIPQQAADDASDGLSAAAEPMLELSESHQPIIRYETLRPSPTQWKMIFDKKGRLLAVSTSNLKVPTVHPVAKESEDKSNARPVPNRFN